MKWILRYLHGMIRVDLLFQRDCDSIQAIVGYIDVDYAGDLDGQQPLAGRLCSHSRTSRRSLSWPMLPDIVVVSTTEAEYTVTT